MLPLNQLDAKSAFAVNVHPNAMRGLPVMAKEKLNVMVTGGTGFVGFHTVMALVNAGHSVRLLVRSPQKMQRVFAPFGLENLPYVKGDITDEASVNTALNGCNAVLHSAALVSVHASDSEKVLNNNLLGTRLVLGGAWQRGIRRMIQVSSTTALFRSGVSGVNEVSPWAQRFQAMDDPKSSVRNLSVIYRTRVHRFILPIPAASWALTILV